jgi:hypothetical protein
MSQVSIVAGVWRMFKEVLLNRLLIWHLCGRTRQAGKDFESDQKAKTQHRIT